MKTLATCLLLIMLFSGCTTPRTAKHVIPLGSRQCREEFYAYRDSDGRIVRHGDDKVYYETGQLHYHFVVRHGVDRTERSYWRSGRKRSDHRYNNGKLHGPSKWWNPDGTLAVVYYYDNGELTGHREFNTESGKGRWLTGLSPHHPECGSGGG